MTQPLTWTYRDPSDPRVHRRFARRPAALVTAAASIGSLAAVVVGATPAVAATVAHTYGTFAQAAWTVPAGVTTVDVDMLGGSGGSGYQRGGAGAHIVTQLDVTPGSTFYIHVGGNNGGPGAGGGSCNGSSGPGGAASDLRTGTDDLAGRILVAGAGGGGGQSAVGGDAGQPGGFYRGTPAQPGSDSAGGAGGSYRIPFSNNFTGGTGQEGQGGNGAQNGCSGGGGAGLYGGGGGGYIDGGAGGSSYVSADAGLHDATVGVGSYNDQPYVTISYAGPTAAHVAVGDQTLPADGTSQAAVTATLADADGKAVSGDTVTLAASDPGVAVSAVTDNGDGTYTATVTASTTAHDVTITATDTSVPGLTGQGTLTLTALVQTVAFTTAAPTGVTVDGPAYTPGASGSSGGNVVISVDAGQTTNSACSISGGVVSFEHAGHCVLDADQNGNDQYAAAPTAQQTITVGKASQTITFAPLTSPAPVGSSQTLSASSTSGGTVSFQVDPSSDAGACTIAGGLVTFTAAGTCVVDADQAGDDDFGAAPRMSQTLLIDHAATTVSVALTKASVVYGESTTATASVSGAVLGSVRFAVDGVPIGAAVPVDANGRAASPQLTGTVGAHQVAATFTPGDTTTYATSGATPRTLIVEQAATSTTVAVTRTTLSATVAATAPGQGTPGGPVTFSVGGRPVGSSTLVDGVAVLGYTLAPGAQGQVAASYPGSATYLASSDSTARTDPTIGATVSSAAGRSRYGWYRGPVTVRFTCTPHGAPLSSVCPSPATLAASGAALSVSRTISAADGGMATVTVTGINIDRRAPAVTIVGVRAKARYFDRAPTARCKAGDALSGVASCTLTHRTRSGRETFTATATDRAGNHTRRTVVVRLLSYAIAGATYSHGSWTVHASRAYTLLAVAGSRPTYVDAAVAPRAPSGPDGAFRSLGHGRWALGITIQRALLSHRYWNIGIKVRRTVHVLRIRVVR